MRAVGVFRPLFFRVSRLHLWHNAILGPRSSFSTSRTASDSSVPAVDFTRIPLHLRAEEETVPRYKAERFYPVHLGEVFKSRYRVVAKLGFGTASTVWLCRDLVTQVFVSLKVCITTNGTADDNNELLVSRHIRSVDANEHPGRQFLRIAHDDFEVESSHGKHQCLIFDPMGINYTDFRNKLTGKVLNKKILQYTLHLLTISLDFLHQAEIIHTDLSPNNVLLGIKDTTVFSEMEQAEINHPASRKILPDRTIYVSRPMDITKGTLVISDFGCARIGKSQTGDVMPTVYRAPEIIMDMEWDCKIDIWALGLMIWDLYEGRRLFRVVKGSVYDDEQHLAEMVSLMGPPPKDFLQRSEKCRRYWDSEGNWIAATPIPDQSLETREERLDGTDKVLLLKLARKILRWLPEERPQAQDLFEDDFIKQALLEDKVISE